MKRAAVVGIAAGAAVVLLAAGAATWLLLRPVSAEEAARDYLTALADGDWDAIQRMRADRLADDGERIVKEGFLGASAYIRDPRIETLDESGGQAAVSAVAEVGGESRDIVFTLARDGSGWVLEGEDHLASVTVHAAFDGGATLPAVRIGGALAPTGSPVALLPAVYDLRAAPESVLEGSAVVGVSSDAPQTVEIAASFSAEATTHVQERLDAYAESCAQPATAVPGNCGLIVPWQADLAELERIAFRIEQLPQVALSPTGSAFDATGGVIVATAHGTGRDGTAGAVTYRADDWALRGSIGYSGDEITLSVR